MAFHAAGCSSRNDQPEKAKGGTEQSLTKGTAGQTETTQVNADPRIIVDPASNLVGDSARAFMDILETTIKADGDNYVLDVLSAAPFPSSAQMAGGKRFDFIWFIDIDKDRGTGQSDRGNDYNIHLFLTETGWDVAWYKVSPVSEKDGVAIQYDQFQRRVDGRRASLVFPKRYLPGKSFEVWVSCFSGNAKDWLPHNENPPTPRAVFDY